MRGGGGDRGWNRGGQVQGQPWRREAEQQREAMNPAEVQKLKHFPSIQDLLFHLGYHWCEAESRFKRKDGIEIDFQTYVKGRSVGAFVERMLTVNPRTLEKSG
jgi:hypothetical protein